MIYWRNAATFRFGGIIRALLLLLIIITATAEDYYLFGMWSYHFDDSKYRQKHNLIGIEKNNKFAYTYINSQNDRSFYVGKIRRDWKCAGKWCLGYNYGILTGYDIGRYKWTPIAFPVLSSDGFIKFDITCAYDIVCAIQFRHEI